MVNWAAGPVSGENQYAGSASGTNYDMASQMSGNLPIQMEPVCTKSPLSMKSRLSKNRYRSQNINFTSLKRENLNAQERLQIEKYERIKIDKLLHANIQKSTDARLHEKLELIK